MTVEFIGLDLITYGCGGRFNPECFDPISNARGGNKPSGGLWASPVNSRHSWREYAEASDDPTIKGFKGLSDSFQTRFVGNAFVIHSEYDVHYLSWFQRQKLGCIAINCIDFESLLADAVDALYLTEGGERDTRDAEPGFYGWSCESIVILNPDCITPVENEVSL